VSFDLFSRIAAMSASSLWALGFVLLVLTGGIWCVAYLILKKAKPGEHFRIKAPFFEIEAGPPAPQPEDADGKIPEQRPPAVEAPKRLRQPPTPLADEPINPRFRGQHDA
jgi:hypothetical protein